MFQKKDTVFYAHSGLCHIEDICQKKILNVEKEYYVLRPLNDPHSLIYVPVDNHTLVSQMQKVLSREEVEAIISQLKEQPDLWIDDKNQRKERFQAILHSGDCLQITTMLKSIHHQRQALIAKKKKLPAADESIYHEAEKMLINTFSHILNLEPNEVIPYIINRVEGS